MIKEFQGEYRFLSNFYGSNPTVEHHYQAAKTLNDIEKEYILSAPTPTIAKKRGRRIQLRSDWINIRLNVMESLVKEKFTRDTELGAKLVATGDEELVEGNYWGDTFWGVCRGVGQNHLGKILMKVREELRSNV
jgi:ribA/ribD-fused uncharacterized protein